MQLNASRFDTKFVAAYLDNLQLPYGAGNDAVLAYHRVFEKRYAKTIGVIDALGLSSRARVLELAAAPYGMTGLLRHYLFDDILLAGYGSLSSEKKAVELGVFDQSYRFDEVLFNVESDVWPFEDGSFDLVIACEMVEHLLLDPMHLFVEANRVLAQKGRLFVSTPNSSSWQNLIKVISFDTPSLVPHFRLPSTIENVYQRHNREYTPGALSVLFDAGGFTMEVEDTTDSYPLDKYALSDFHLNYLYNKFGPHSKRGDTLNYIGVKSQGVRQRYPTSENLYHISDL